MTCPRHFETSGERGTLNQNQPLMEIYVVGEFGNNPHISCPQCVSIHGAVQAGETADQDLVALDRVTVARIGRLAPDGRTADLAGCGGRAGGASA